MSGWVSYKDIIIDIIDKAVYRTIRDINYSIDSAYKSAIRDFYNFNAFGNKNKPYKYKRTFNLFTATNLYGKDINSIITYIKDSHYSSNFEVDDIYLQSGYKGKYKHKSVEPEWVFDRAFYEGIHGFTREEVFAVNNSTSRKVYLATGGKHGKPPWNIKHIPKQQKKAPIKKMNDELQKKWNIKYNPNNNSYSITQQSKINRYLNEQIADSIKRRKL